MALTRAPIRTGSRFALGGRVAAIGQRPDAEEEDRRPEEFAEQVSRQAIERGIRREDPGPSRRRAGELAVDHGPSDDVVRRLEGGEGRRIVGIHERRPGERAEHLGGPVGEQPRPGELAPDGQGQGHGGVEVSPLRRPLT